MLLKILLFAQLVYVVNAVHFPLKTGIPGVVPANILFGLILLSMRGQADVTSGEGLLKRPLLYFYAAMTFALVWAQVRDFRDLIVDVTYWKNALFYPLFYFLYLKCRQDEKTTRQLIITVMIIAALAGLEAFREGLDYGFGAYNAMRRASGPFGEDWRNANRAGVFFGMFMPMFAALAIFLRGQKIWRIAAIGGCFFLAAGTLATYSRQAYFLVLLSIGLLFLRKSVVLATIIGVVLVSAVGFLPDSVTQRVEETKQAGTEGQQEFDGSTASRWEIWSGAMAMWTRNPLGVGLNRFKNEIGTYSPTHKNMDAHNFYVLTLAETGPAGLITLLLLFRAAFGLAAHLRKNAPPGDAETQALTLGFTVCTLCTALGGLYGSPTLEGSVMAPYWALCGLLERYIQLKGGIATATPTSTSTEASLVERFPLAAHLPGAGRG